MALDPTLDIETIRAHLATIPVICAGGDAAGPMGKAITEGAIPLADCASKRGDPDLARPYRPVRRSSRRARASARHDGAYLARVADSGKADPAIPPPDGAFRAGIAGDQ